MQKKIYLVGIGPGNAENMTRAAYQVVENCDAVIGYSVYTQLIENIFPNKEFITTAMRQEKERCRLTFQEAQKGKTVALVCSGDAGIYGLASLMYEIQPEFPDCELEVIPGVSAAISGAAKLGAPLNHDTCLISLSDALTPWEVIEKRLLAAAEGDFCIALYNPSSRKRPDYLKRACEILLRKLPPTRICGYVKAIGREGTEEKVCTLDALADERVDMFTTVFIGNSTTIARNGKMITPRGYQI